MKKPVHYFTDDAIKAALMLCATQGYDIDSPSFSRMTVGEVFVLTRHIIVRESDYLDSQLAINRRYADSTRNLAQVTRASDHG